MTTNAILLPRLARPLAEAGLRRLNVHVDTLHPERLKRLMRFGTIEEIEAGIAAAEEAGLLPIKLNCVVTRDYNDADVVDLARRARERELARALHRAHAPRRRRDRAHRPLPVRAQPRDPGPASRPSSARCEPVRTRAPSDEARNFRFADGSPGVVGFISPVSEPYCGACNRMRLTADGKFHLCLLNDDELDVKAALRGGGGESEVAAILGRAVAPKPTGHRLDEGISTEDRSMFQIGG